MIYDALWQSDRSDLLKWDSLSHVILNRSKVVSLDFSLDSHVTLNLILTSLASDIRHCSSRMWRSLCSVNFRTFSDNNKQWSKLFTNSSSHYYLLIWCFNFHDQFCAHGALHLTSCCSNQVLLLGSKCRSRFSKSKEYICLPFKITSIYFCSHFPCLFSNFYDFLFISFPVIPNHYLVNYPCIYWRLSFSYMQNCAESSKVTCRYNILFVFLQLH